MTGITDSDIDALFEGVAPANRPPPPRAAATNPDALRFVAFNPAGLCVKGTHDPDGVGVLPQLVEDFSSRHAQWLEKIQARPGGFDGKRAVLLSFKVAGNSLQAHTGFRSYTQGRALHDAIRAARDTQELVLDPSDFLRPRPGLSWGASLATFVLLPHEHVLCVKRARGVAVAPGEWQANFTEMLEPSDINRKSMDKLLDRLVAKELPPLTGLGVHKYVGLGVTAASYTWQLVSVIDMRRAQMEQVVGALNSLAPSSESDAWGVHPLYPIADDERPYPLSLYHPETLDSGRLSTAEFLARNLTPC